MGLIERRDHLVQEIKKINDEQTLEMLEETLAFYGNTGNKDITDDLDSRQLSELVALMKEPAESNTITEEEFRKLFARWSTE